MTLIKKQTYSYVGLQLGGVIYSFANNLRKTPKALPWAAPDFFSWVQGAGHVGAEISHGRALDEYIENNWERGSWG